MRCDASNRLLRNSSRDRPDDGIRVPVFISMVGRGVMTFSQRIHVVSTGSHPKEIPIFFLIFLDFSGISGVSPIKPTYIWDFWGPGGGVNSPVFFQNLP